jgi:murein DD-endopeptidase MepM/ murein hydrolase activator NlpD
MSTNNIAPVSPSVTPESGSTTRSEDRARLATLAAEFESMLLTSVLRDMRTSGRWSGSESERDMFGADTFNQTFDAELARTLSQAGGFGLSKWLTNAFDALDRAMDASPANSAAGAASAASSASSAAATGVDGTATTAKSAFTGRTGWNGLRLDAPPPGGSGAQWAGFNNDRALSGGDDGSVKDAFFRWTSGLSFNPAGKSKEAIGEFLKNNVQSAREYGLNIVDVQREQILIETQERGFEWVDVVVAAGSTNPGETKWQWHTMLEEGVPTGGGALGTALNELRSAPGGSERARAFLASNSLTGDALLSGLKAEASAARAGGGRPVVAEASQPVTIDTLMRPTAEVTSQFGWRQDPITGALSFHRGIDLRAAEGAPVPSTGAGRVISAGSDGGYGTNVVIEHADGLRTLYAHLSTALVKAGDEVAAGQRIGLAGQTGRATGPHVHYEVLADGRRVDPLQ